MNTDCLQSCVRFAVYMANRRDAHLVDADVREDAMSGRIAYYIEDYLVFHRELNELSVDVEYNKHKFEEKTIPVVDARCIGFKKTPNASVRPDIIVHFRGNDNSNALVIELKKADSDANDILYDLCKLTIMTNKKLPEKYRYGYELGLILMYASDGNGGINWAYVWFVNGDIDSVLNSKISPHLETALTEYIKRRDTI
jgi:hypothetical protein